MDTELAVIWADDYRNHIKELIKKNCQFRNEISYR